MIRVSLPTKAQLEKVSAITSLAADIDNLTHLATHVPAIKNYSIFNDRQVREAIRLTFGRKTLERLDKELSQVLRGRSNVLRAANSIERSRGFYVISTLGFKVKQFFTQTVSSVSSLFEPDINVVDFIRYYPRAFRPKNSNFIRERVSALRNRGISNVLVTEAEKENINQGILGKIKETPIKNMKGRDAFAAATAMQIVKRGDANGAVPAAYVVYKTVKRKYIKNNEEIVNQYIRDGATEEDARQRLEDTADRIATNRAGKNVENFQQSTFLSRLNDWQKGNWLEKMFATFLSSANAIFRAEVRAVQLVSAGRLSPLKGARTIFIAHSLIPMLVQLIADGFEIDKGNQQRAALLGGFNAVILVGDLIDSAHRLLTSQTNRFASPTPPYVESLTKLVDEFTSIDPDEITFEQITEALLLGEGEDVESYRDSKNVIDGTLGLVQISGIGRGLPLKTGQEILTAGYRNTLEGDFSALSLTILGFTAKSKLKILEDNWKPFQIREDD